MKLCVKKGIAIFLYFLLVSSQLLSQKKSGDAPDIIIIYVDDMGYGDLSSYGSEIPTPNIDQIGKQGIRFTDFYVASPVCTPSRFSLLTGQYPQHSKHNLSFALMPGDKNYLDTTEHTIAWYLKQKNYRTGIVGKWHLGKQDSSSRPTQYGFDYFSGTMGGCIDYFNHDYGSMGPDWYIDNNAVTEEGYSTDLLTNHAIDFIRSTKKEQSFFLYLAYNAPHYGKTDTGHIQPHTLSLGKAKYKGFEDINSLQAPEKYMKQFEHIADPYRRTYAAMVASLDDNVGRLMNWLKENKKLDNTIIWFMSDNGGYAVTHQRHASNGNLKGEKAQLWEGGIHVPAMLMWKKKIKGGQLSHSPVCNVDVLPTLAAITGCSESLSKTIDGVDLVQLLLNQQPLQRSLYWKFNNQTAFRQGDWKLVNGKELYNLKVDAAEKQNVADQYPEIVKQLNEAQLQKEMEIKNGLGAKAGI
jgi:arylsulfatase A-like enzyme